MADYNSATICITEKSNKALKEKPVYDFFKRLFDIVLSVVAIILLSPILLILFIIVKATSKGPAIYKHKRVGKDGKTIYIYKFRSMVVDADKMIHNFTPEQKAEFEKNFKLENDPRVTKIGKFLRKTSLDELPQLFNILKGDIAFIGPRPVTQAETELYGSNRELLLSIRPGLTGFWASNGRSDTSYKRRRAMELYYVKNRSFGFDIKIFFKT
ncbi:MAG: sugar transferase, partial [Clostridia bacterium]|nr:sugar transferase [Clostridia bacterium]